MMRQPKHTPKNVKRFSDKTRIENKPLERRSDPIRSQHTLMRISHQLEIGSSAAVIASTMLLILCFALFVLPAEARQQRLLVEVGKAVRLAGAKTAESIFVADPTIADISSSPGQAQYLYGKSVGETTVIAADVSGRTLFSINLIVIHDLSALRRSLQQRYPSQSVSLSSARGSILVSGRVSDEIAHQGIIATLRNSAPDNALIDELTVENSKMIRLDVQLIQVLPSYADQPSWADAITSLSTGVSYSQRHANKLRGIIDFLLARGYATVVTAATLITSDNKKAEFSWGNEISLPVPVQGKNGGFTYGRPPKFVGLNITFQPQCLPGDRVSLEVTSDFSGAWLAPSTEIANGAPTFTSRHLTTSVELFNNESMAVSGVDLGWKRGFVMVVTPHFATGDKLTSMTAGASQTNLEYILTQKQPASRRKPVHINGPAGFLY